MAFRRRRSHASTIQVDPVRTAKFTDSAQAKQGKANSFQQWLLAGCLCRATAYVMVFHNPQFDEGIEQTWCSLAFSQYDSQYVAVIKGESVMYLGELYRRRIKDVWAPGGVRVQVAHKFLSPRRGVILCDPTYFEDAFTEDVKDAVTG